MRPEKTTNEESIADIEKQKFDDDSSSVNLQDTENEILLGFKKLLDQGVANLEFKEDENGKVESVTITRILTGEVLFYADKNSWMGQEAIRRILGLMNPGQSD